ncbi:hypothetical protein [Deinococcus sp. UYEF24]
MSFLQAIWDAGVMPDDSASGPDKKNYGERLSNMIAREVATLLRAADPVMENVKPVVNAEGETVGREKEFRGGFSDKKIDISVSDEQHGLVVGGSVKTLNFSYSKNLKNRFGDLAGESVNMHLRFPYAVMFGIFAMPEAANADHLRPDGSAGRMTRSSFERATELMATVAGRPSYSDPGERYEHMVMLLFMPREPKHQIPADLHFKLVDAVTRQTLSEQDYVNVLMTVIRNRNPHQFI